MKITRKTIAMTGLATLAAGGLSLLPPAHADTLSFTDAPASSVVAAMNKRYGVTIVFRSAGLNTNQPVTFSVDNPDTPDGRLQAVSSLANALNLDFQKVYVVSKADPGAEVPPVPIDSDGPIVFPSAHIPVRDAIQTVASVDNALTQISDEVDGDVTLPQTRLRAIEAAGIIAKQTRTQWKAYYGLFRHGETPERLSGTVVGRTASGQPIRELPLLTFRNTISTPAPLHSGQDAVVGPFAPRTQDPTVASIPTLNSGFDPYSSPYGYGDPYGSGYGSPYGYVAPDGSYAVPGSVYTPGAGVAPAVPGVNAPGAGTVPLLPSFPYMGSVGGQTVVGGY